MSLSIKSGDFYCKSFAELRLLYGSALDEFDVYSDLNNFSLRDALQYAVSAWQHESVVFLLARGAFAESRLLFLLIRTLSRGYNGAGETAIQLIFDTLVANGADPLQLCQLTDPSLLELSVGTLLFTRCVSLCQAQINHVSLTGTALSRAFILRDMRAIRVLKKLGATTPRGLSGVFPVFARDYKPQFVVELVDSDVQLVCYTYIGYEHTIEYLDDTFTVLYVAGQDLDLSTARSLPERFKESFSEPIDSNDYRLRNYYRLQILHRYTAIVTCVENLCSACPLATAEGPRIRQWSLYILRRFALDACIGLASLCLPALITTTILQALLDTKWPNIIHH